MKKFTLSTLVMSLGAMIIVLLYLEACSITGKGWEAELGPISIKMEEVEADFGKSVVLKLIENVKDDHPEKYEEAIKKICEEIKLYEQASENYRVLSEAMNGIPNMESVQSGFNTMSESFKNRAESYKDLLKSYDIDCDDF